MTDPKPRSTASRTSVPLVAWSRWTATGPSAAAATASMARPIGASAPW